MVRDSKWWTPTPEQSLQFALEDLVGREKVDAVFELLTGDGTYADGWADCAEYLESKMWSIIPNLAPTSFNDETSLQDAYDSGWEDAVEEVKDVLNCQPVVEIPRRKR